MPSHVFDCTRSQKQFAFSFINAARRHNLEKTMQATNTTGSLATTYGFYKPDPGNGLNPLMVEDDKGLRLQVYAPERCNGMSLTIDRDEFMTIDEMCEATLAVLADQDHPHRDAMLRDHIESMTNMQRFLLQALEQTRSERAPTVVIDMDGSAIHNVTSTGPARVLLLDADLEGADDKRVAVVGGAAYYVHDHRLHAKHNAASRDVDRAYVLSVTAQLDH